MSYTHFITDTATPVFLFHGVVPQHRFKLRNYLRKHIDQDHFYQTLRQLLKAGTPLSLDECIPLETDKGFTPPKPRGFVVTFDDGFQNNLSFAAPILEELKIPATFYVTTDFVDRNEGSWIDKIETAFELTPSVKLSTPFKEINVRVSQSEEKMTVLNHIRNRVKNDSSIDPYEFASEVTKQLGWNTLPMDSDLDQKLNWEGVKELSRNPLFRLGGHGHTHRILSFLSEGALDKELDTSLSLLQTKAEISTRHYCYPDGQANCYSSSVIHKLRDRGIVCAPTAIQGTNPLGKDLFHLNRIMVT